MVFSDPVYFVFLGAVLLLVPLLAGRGQIIFLTFASYVFYASWNPPFTLLLIASTVLDYYLALAIDGASNPARKKQFLAVSILFNLGLLGYFKYAHFVWNSTRAAVTVLGVTLPDWPFQVILPLGISFYTFITLSYVIDVYYGTIKPCTSMLKYAFFISFFPHLIAGPILRGGELLPQIDQPRKVGGDDIREAVGLFFRGYVKKVCVADTLGLMLVDPVYAHPERYGTVTFWLAMAAFAIQVYGDFSGYTDMGRASARLLGFNLPVNFNFPFLAQNPQDFWRRWHITLSRWIRDYVFFFALGGFRASGFKLLWAVMATMALGGLWHGASWTFVVWGLYHGTWLVSHYFYRTLAVRYFGWERWHRQGWYAWTCRAAVFFGFSFGQILSRAPDFSTALTFMKGLIGGVAGPGQLFSGQCFLLMGLTLIAHTYPLWPERRRPGRWCPAFGRDVVYAGVIVYVMVTLIAGVKPFIYFQF